MKTNACIKAVMTALIILSAAPSAVYAANNPPKAGIITPVNGSSLSKESITFSATYTDPDGYQDLAGCYLLINNTTGDAKCFAGYYDGKTNRMYISDDAGAKWIGGYNPGYVYGAIENSYVRVDSAKSSVVLNGSALTVNWVVSFKSKFAGLKNIYMKAVDKKNASSGSWVKKGTWKITADTLSVSVNPKEWNIGGMPLSSVATMAQSNKIIITNNGEVNESFELKLTNPPGWTAGAVPGTERYALSALICGTFSIPKNSDFNANLGNEDVVTVDFKKATASVFGYAAAPGNGSAVPPGSKRALYLQFKSPVETVSRAENNISIIINCQAS